MKRNLLLTFALLMLSCALSAQVNTAPFPLPIPQFFDATGAPLAGGKVLTFAAGTTTPLATYTDGTGLVQNTNPIILSAAGFPTNASGSIVGIWLGPQKYKVILQDSLGVQQWSVDLVGGNNLFSLANINMAESTAPAPNIGFDMLWADSAGHRFKMSNDNSAGDFVVGQNTTDTLTNKALISPALTTPTITSETVSGTNSHIGVDTFAILNKEVWVGTTYATIEAALAALPNGNGVVRLPAGFSETITSCISIPHNQTAVVGPQYGSASVTINADVDGFCAPQGTQNIRLENIAISTANGVVLSSNHAAVHLRDTPRPILRNLLISTEATAGGCVLIEGTQDNPSFGPWDGMIDNVTCQRTSPNQGTADSALGHFGIWLNGTASFTNADVTSNLLTKNWIENMGVGLRLTYADDNTILRQHLLLNSINLLIENTSKDNYIVARLNQFRDSGSPVSGTNEHYNIDATSADNILWLKLETPSTNGTDGGIRTDLMLGATDSWEIGSAVSFNGFTRIKDQAKIVTTDFTDANSAALQAITGLSFPLQENTTYDVKCSLMYSQATNVSGDQFGVGIITTAPVSASFQGQSYTNTGAASPESTGVLSGLASTTPTAVVTFQPAVTGTLGASLKGSIETGAGGSTFNVYVLNGTAADVIVVKRDSSCVVTPVY